MWGSVVAFDGVARRYGECCCVAVCVFVCREGGECSKCDEAQGSGWFCKMEEDGLGTLRDQGEVEEQHYCSREAPRHPIGLRAGRTRSRGIICERHILYGS